MNPKLIQFVGAIAVIGILPLNSLASEALSDFEQDYLTVGSVRVQEVRENQSVEAEFLQDYRESIQRELDDIVTYDNPQFPDGGIGDIINIGLKLWDIVKDNEPVLDFAQNVANALPENVENWRQLDRWSQPEVKTYQVVYENLLGMKVVEFTYRVVYTHSGSMEGVGSYLTHVTIAPADVNVLWGYTFNAQAKVIGITNSGTRQDPNAAMELALDWYVGTVIKKNRHTENFYLRGDGYFRVLSL